MEYSVKVVTGKCLTNNDNKYDLRATNEIYINSYIIIVMWTQLSNSESEITKMKQLRWDWRFYLWANIFSTNSPTHSSILL